MSEPQRQHVRIDEGVVFGHAGGRDLTCDVFTPEETPAPRPAILMLHGGGWEMGDPTMMRGYGIRMGRRGFTCVSSEYRLTGEAPWPAQIEDVLAALRWLETSSEKLGIDPSRIAIWGLSAGGHLALLAAGGGSSVAAAVAFYPITDIGPEMGRAWDRYVPSLVPGGASPEERRAMSPLTHVDERFPPTLLLHGAEDDLVAPRQSLSFLDALREAGVPAGLYLIAGQPHGFDLDRDHALHAVEAVSLFLARYLGEGGGA